jgi:hypothetical protein
MQSMLFARITKIDESTRTVTGRAVQEILDRDGEIFDYASSVPNFQKWSAEVFADSGGKSFGNVRSMHGNVAAGKLTDIEFNDAEKAIDVSAKIVDDGEWEKCLQGVHTGFSIGGKYARKWSEIQDGKIIQRYTAVPAEVSLVDRPCVPTAKFFEVHKRDGSIERRAFQSHEEVSTMTAKAYRGQFLTKLQPREFGDGREATDAALKKLHRRGPTRPDSLAKRIPTSGHSDAARAARRLAGQVVEGLVRAGLTPVGALKAMAGSGYSGVDGDSIDAIRKIHGRGARKGLVLPPQDDDANGGGAIADTGATNDSRDQATPRTATTRLGPRHTASISDGRAPATQDDPTVKALKAIFAAGPKRGL